MQIISRYIVFFFAILTGSLQPMREDNGEDENRKRKNIESTAVLMENQKKPKKMKKIDVQKVINEAFEALKKGQNDQAINLYEQLLAQPIPFKEAVNCWMNLGLAYWRVQKKELAISMFEKVLNSKTKKKIPDIVRIRFYYAKLLLEMNNKVHTKEGNQNRERSVKLLEKCAKQSINKDIATAATELLCSFYKAINKKEQGLPWANELMNNDNLETCFIGHYYWIIFRKFKNNEEYLKNLNDALKIFDKLPKEAQAEQLYRYNYIVEAIVLLKKQKMKPQNHNEESFSESDSSEQ